MSGGGGILAVSAVAAALALVGLLPGGRTLADGPRAPGAAEPAKAAAPEGGGTQRAPRPPAAGPDGIVRFPSLRVKTREGYLEADGRVCLQRGLIEVFACTPYGKVHEAVLVLDCRPEHLHAGLLLLGMKETPGQVHELGGQGALAGERASVLVSWTEDGKVVERPAEELLLDSRTGESMPRTGWVFTGSRFLRVGGRERFAANASGQMITTFHDPDAILDNPLVEGGDDTIYYANSKLLPRPGTPVLVRIAPAAATQTALPAPAETK
jgi:hypothetical protein